MFFVRMTTRNVRRGTQRGMKYAYCACCWWRGLSWFLHNVFARLRANIADWRWVVWSLGMERVGGVQGKAGGFVGGLVCTVANLGAFFAWVWWGAVHSVLLNVYIAFSLESTLPRWMCVSALCAFRSSHRFIYLHMIIRMWMLVKYTIHVHTHHTQYIQPKQLCTPCLYERHVHFRAVRKSVLALILFTFKLPVLSSR